MGNSLNEYFLDDFKKALMNCAENYPISRVKGQAFSTAYYAVEIYYSQDDKNQIGIPYMWVLTIGETNFVGRSVDDLIGALRSANDILNDIRKKIIVWSFNAGITYYTLQKYLDVEKVFGDGLEVMLSKFCNVEFRSIHAFFKLSLCNLAKMMEFKQDIIDSHLWEKDGEILTTESKLRQKDIDRAVLTADICAKAITYMCGDRKITNIPFTRVGYVRSYIRSKFKKKGEFSKNKRRIRSLCLDEMDFEVCRDAFRGGLAQLNPGLVNIPVKDVEEFDIKSAYPAAMLLDKYPMSPPYPIDNKIFLEQDHAGILWIATIRIKKFKSRSSNINYLTLTSFSSIENEVRMDGGVYSADAGITTVTNLDWAIIKEAYVFEDYDLIYGIYFRSDYLPRYIRDVVMEFYTNKEIVKELDGISKAEQELIKQDVNCIFGLLSQDPLKYCKSEEEKRQRIKDYNNSVKRFSYYPWGVFITAHVRYKLAKIVLKYGSKFIYCATDSIYIDIKDTSPLRDHNIATGRITKKLYADKAESIKNIGYFDYKGHWDYFKCVGIGRYIKYNKDVCKLTISGSPISGVVSREEYVKKFGFGMAIPKNRVDYKINDDIINIDVTDYEGKRRRISLKSNIYAYWSDYKILPASYDILLLEEHNIIK